MAKAMSRSNKPKHGDRLIAFDQATRHTGFACFEGPDLRNYGLLEASGKDSDARLDEMAVQMRDLIRRYNPKFIVFEGVLFQKSPNALIMLANLQGILRGICQERGCGYAVYAPTSWRSLIGLQQGKGITRDKLKEQAVQFVRAAYGIEVEEDVCEAICIGLAHLKKSGALPPLPDYKENI